VGGANKYKIIDIDGSEITLTDLLDRYFFSENPYTSCSVIETKYYNHVIEESSIVEQIEDSEIENLDEAKELFQQKAKKKNHMNVITAINLIQQIIKMIMRNTLYYLMMENLHILQWLTLKEII
jgi:hexokinase